MLDDIVSVTMRSAADGLAARQRVIADNIANAQTPGYLAKRVTFENALAAAVGSRETGRIAATRPDVQTSLEPTRMDGNNVNLDREVLANIDTNLRFQMVTQAISGKANGLRTAIGLR